jgi:serine/threonine protein phosphatase PrpC
VIHSYGFSIVGSSHEKKGSICQDANKVIKLENGVVIGAIADGVGSCKYSDVASIIAVDTSLRVCSEEINANGINCDVIPIITKALEKAEREIDERSLSENQLITEYDTTLSLAIYDGKHITYGHCGDGGIIGLTIEGDYKKITLPQKKEGVYVIPLRAGKDTWIFGKTEDELASVLLATDGVYDIFFPYLLKGQPVEVYIPLIRYFMDNNILKSSEETIDNVCKEREVYFKSEACVSITDDKTIVVLINDEVKPKEKEDSYYTEPDWESLQLEWNKKAYPHLYEKKDNNDESQIGNNADIPLKNEVHAKKEEKPIKKKWCKG